MHARFLFFPPFLKKIPEQSGTLLGQYTGTHIRLMVQSRTACDIEQGFTRPCFAVCTPVNDTADAAHHNRTSTHGARLDGDIERQPRQSPPSQCLTGTADRDQLCMCCGIVLRLTEIVSARNDTACIIKDDSTDGNLSA